VSPRYPREAVRELLVNALVHRDWTRLVEIELVVYADRLEVTSPGPLPNTMTIEKMIAGQRSPRNTILVDVLRDYGYVDARGMGIRNKVVPLVRAMTGTDPVFEETDDYLRTILPKG
jgi:ATP-dependent DNA helicase RecG